MLPVPVLLAGLAGAAGLAYQIRPRETDSADNRRKLGKTLALSTSYENVAFATSYFTTSKGVKLATYEFAPENKPSKGVIYVCHGYCDNIEWLWYGRCVRLASEGYTCIGVDLEGFGRSDGLLAFIPSFEQMVTGAYEYFQQCKSEKFEGKKSFLMGESMGGAVALHMLLLFGQDKSIWNGLVLFAPMCKIAEDMVPPAAVVKTLTMLSGLIPTWPVVPSPNVVSKAFRDKAFVDLVKSGPFYVDYQPRIATAIQLLHATTLIDERMDQITAPFLLMHGAADSVTDPQMSKTLYERSQSKDKTLKLYPEVWHSVLEDPDSETVWKDLFEWLASHL